MIGIVGGGITGLALGWELERLGADFVIFEAAARTGGVIRSERVEGRVLDHGPQRVRLTPAVARVVDGVGLGPRIVEVPAGLDLLVHRAGRLHPVPLSVGAVLRSPALGAVAKLRLLLEPLTAGLRPGERVDAYFRRKVGAEVYETLIAPFFGGLYGSDPADMDAETALAPVLGRLGVRRSLVARLGRGDPRAASAPAVGFPDGMEELPRALHASLADRVRTAAPVEAVARAGRGWRLTVDGGAVVVDRVVVATPADVAARMLRASAPALAEAAGRLRYNPVRVVHLQAETELRGLGFQVAFGEGERTLRGVTFNDSLFGPYGRQGVYTAYLGGGTGAGGESDAHLAELAVAGFRRCTGYGSRPLAVVRSRMPAWDATWRGLRDVRLPGGLHVAANWWSRPGLAGRLAEARGLAARLVEGAGVAPAGRVA